MEHSLQGRRDDNKHSGMKTGKLRTILISKLNKTLGDLAALNFRVLFFQSDFEIYPHLKFKILQISNQVRMDLRFCCECHSRQRFSGGFLFPFLK